MNEVNELLKMAKNLVSKDALPFKVGALVKAFGKTGVVYRISGDRASVSTFGGRGGDTDVKPSDVENGDVVPLKRFPGKWCQTSSDRTGGKPPSTKMDIDIKDWFSKKFKVGNGKRMPFKLYLPNFKKTARSLVGSSNATFRTKTVGEDIWLIVTVAVDDNHARGIFADLMDAEKEAVKRCRKAAGEDWAKLHKNWSVVRGGLTQTWLYEYGAEEPDIEKQIKRTLERG